MRYGLGLRWCGFCLKILGGGTYETDVAARKPRAEYTRGLTIVGEAWDYMGNLTEVVYSISFVY